MEANNIAIDSVIYEDMLQQLTHDVYHLPRYILEEAEQLGAQAGAIAISEGSKQFLVPYLLRQCPEDLYSKPFPVGTLYDVVSPYGYPGILMSQEAQADSLFLRTAIQKLITTFQVQQICSAFLRLHPILNSDFPNLLQNADFYLEGTTVSIDLTLPEYEQWSQIQSSRRNRINRCKRQEFCVKILPFAQEHILIFMDIYQDTMDRLNARESYYFKKSYYESLIALEPHVFICIITHHDQPICAGIFTECCGIVQYHLSGTKTEFLSLYPSNLMLNEMRLWSKAQGNKIFHLGGGLGSRKDSLFDFKASFSKQRHSFCTLRLISDLENYQILARARARQIDVDIEKLINMNYFPSYRASKI
jgi:hypothetical protein